ncbi:SipW-dependent-type signal peptide-containing protein [Zhenhengia yiwuensis]|uniref:SipW-dependent-type signal peptide-containing protein n=1 Tax=Zhenhengia yiwuensis TaxID=2763666 RepID=UPI002A75B11E|nr:SipW-dependent-type signal peptide-containing protein [Zhenhengia yiwuensis]MDY3367448.1 SipW-dependent-type signal peptide-containing protein [Zhenhengia yiwuensis]
MKRSKFMIGALVLSMGLLGTGYAYWTDALQVNTTVTTGKLDVNVTEGDMTFKYVDENSAMNGENAFGTLKAEGASENLERWETAPVVEVAEDGTAMNIQIGNLHPGTEFRYTYTLTNDSTMPIKAVVNAATTLENVKGNLNELEVKLERGDTIISAEDKETFAEKIQYVLEEAYGNLAPDQETLEDTLVITAPGGLNEETLVEDQIYPTLTFNIEWHQHNDPAVSPKVSE